MKRVLLLLALMGAMFAGTRTAEAHPPGAYIYGPKVVYGPTVYPTYRYGYLGPRLVVPGPVVYGYRYPAYGYRVITPGITFGY